MLRTTSGLSRPVLKWMSQVAASLGATLAATLIWSAVPHPGAAPAAEPEMTSGGKFAARAIQPVAYDGLDTMPLPHTAPPAARFVALTGDVPATPVLHRAAWDEPVPSPGRAVRATRSLRHVVEPRRTAPAARAAAASADLVADASEADVRADDGFLHGMVPSGLPRLLPALVSTARDAWSVTASAGGTLVSHVVPRLP